MTTPAPRVWEQMATARRGTRTGDIGGFHAYVRPTETGQLLGRGRFSYVIFFRNELVATGFAASTAAAQRRAGDRLDLIEDAVSDYFAPLVRLVTTSPVGTIEALKHLAVILPDTEYEQLHNAVAKAVA